jgi:hypothetical protein
MRPGVAMDDSGDFVVVWTSIHQDTTGYGSFGQRFQAPSFEITDPNDGDTLDCTDPRVNRPTITWDPTRYDRFRVFLASDTSFRKRVKVTSGDRMLKSPSWTPSRKKWRRACNKAITANQFSPVLYIRVLGKDRDLPKKDPGRKGYTPVGERESLRRLQEPGRRRVVRRGRPRGAGALSGRQTGIVAREQHLAVLRLAEPDGDVPLPGLPRRSLVGAGGGAR